jgi:hypothetical protein
MNKSFKEWLTEGEQLYAAALKEYQDLEQEISALEQHLTSKRGEVNQIASVIGKPPIDGVRRVSAQIIDEAPIPSAPVPLGAIGRALSGRGAVMR